MAKKLNEEIMSKVSGGQAAFVHLDKKTGNASLAAGSQNLVDEYNKDHSKFTLQKLQGKEVISYKA